MLPTIFILVLLATYSVSESIDNQLIRRTPGNVLSAPPFVAGVREDPSIQQVVIAGIKRIKNEWDGAVPPNDRDPSAQKPYLVRVTFTRKARRGWDKYAETRTEPVTITIFMIWQTRRGPWKLLKIKSSDYIWGRWDEDRFSTCEDIHDPSVWNAWTPLFPKDLDSWRIGYKDAIRAYRDRRWPHSSSLNEMKWDAAELSRLRYPIQNFGNDLLAYGFYSASGRIWVDASSGRVVDKVWTRSERKLYPKWVEQNKKVPVAFMATPPLVPQIQGS